jgi:hypothetical protein
MKRNYWNCGLSEWFKKRFVYTTQKIRKRDEEGKYVGDDKTTPDVDEAYTSSKVKETSPEGFMRARDNKGQYVGDDESTPNVNEAYTKTKRK